MAFDSTLIVLMIIAFVFIGFLYLIIKQAIKRKLQSAGRKAVLRGIRGKRGKKKK